MSTSKREGRRYVMISAVAERYDIHPQTLRLYEREGLLEPVRSAGNTRLYDRRALSRLESILTLTRDMGVNLAGVEVILNLQDQIAELEQEIEELRSVQKRSSPREKQTTYALVRVQKGHLIKL